MIYLDHNATTRVAPEVLDAMLPWLVEKWGNPSSVYQFGRQGREAIDTARAQVAELLHAEPQEVIFTSCGTESINTAIRSALSTQPGKRHLVTTAVEHSATLHPCKQLEKQGVQVTWLPVAPDGTLDVAAVDRAIRPDTALVSLLWANNETGVIFPIQEIAAVCAQRQTMVHVDAVQAAGRLTIDVSVIGADFLSISGHKIHAPKGVGALFVNRRNRFAPWLSGGGQESNRRAGTENVAGIVALGRAAVLARTHLIGQMPRVGALRDTLEERLLESIPGAHRNGSQTLRLPNTANLSFEGVESEAVLLLLDREGICASSGSACTTGSPEPSHVLRAMGVGLNRARGAIRFSLGAANTREDIEAVAGVLPGIIKKLRSESPSAAGLA